MCRGIQESLITTRTLFKAGKELLVEVEAVLSYPTLDSVLDCRVVDKGSVEAMGC